MSTDYIPDHVLSHIFLRLPVKSLLRFKCVSKSWRDLIDSSYLKDMHHGFIRPLPNPDSTIIAMFHGKIYTFDTVVENGEKEYRAIIAKKMSPDVSVEEHLELRLAESCNGIICWRTSEDGDFALWNPSTGSKLYGHQLTPPPYEFTMGYKVIQCALGYDHINDDYKLLKWHLNGCPAYFGNGMDLFEVCVYSFKHKSWTTITDAGELGVDADSGYFPGDSCYTFANGKIYWLMSGLILAFDLGTYKFQKIPSAPISAGHGYFGRLLSSLNGYLCLSHLSSTNADIWVMNESWTKIACIDINPYYIGYCKAVAYSEERGKLLLQPYVGKKLFMYDLDTKSLRDVAVFEDGHNCSYKHITSCVCVGSFVGSHLL